MKAIIEVAIDEETLLKFSECETIEGAVEQEFGWLEGSGIYLDKIIELEEFKDD